MSVTAVVGANWGDEGKGKMADVLARDADYVVRFQGGANAGHTVVNEFGSFALHNLPCGVFRANCVNVIGPGVALDAESFGRELESLLGRGVPRPRLAVSSRCKLLFEYHRLLDEYEEDRLAEQSFGSTRRGMAPFYADNCSKLLVLADDLCDEGRLVARVKRALETKAVLFEHFYGRPTPSAERIVERAMAERSWLEPLLCDTSELLQDALERGARILLEGQLGALRDVHHGSYPFVTSSSTLAGFASVGAGLPAARIARVVAVTKAYSTCVGAGTFVSEQAGEVASELRRRGGQHGEYGATTGRARRVGWFDAVATRYGCLVQGATELCVTGLDVLGYLPRIPVCTAYRVDGRRITRFPTPRLLERASAEYEMLPGWNESLRGVRNFDDLPAAARAYLAALERMVGIPVRFVSTGPHRDDLIER